MVAALLITCWTAVAQPLDLSYWVAGEPLELAEQDIAVVAVWSRWCESCQPSWRQLESLQRRWPDLPVVAVTDDAVLDAIHHVETVGEPSFRVAVDGTNRLPHSLIFGEHGGYGYPSVYVIQGGDVHWGGRSSQVGRVLSRLSRNQDSSTSSSESSDVSRVASSE